uniref:Uncharacterized protein n=1 Tax=Avena sativa TaxID=4498 RepID=A0ACD5ZLN9_AVESA
MRRLCSLAGGRSRSYADRFPSLLDPLPGLHLPPALRDEHQQQSLPPPLPHTEVTTLPNGVRIASQDIPGPMCCVGVTVACGSSHETPSTAGASYMLERLAFQETHNRGLGEIARSVEATGGTLGAKAGRERMFYRYSALRASLPLAVEVLLDCVRNPAFLRSQVRSKARRSCRFWRVIMNCFSGNRYTALVIRALSETRCTLPRKPSRGSIVVPFAISTLKTILLTAWF